MRPVHAPRKSFLSSDLSRHSGAVFAAAEDHPIQVTRRDGESLVLMSQREADARDTLLELAAQLIAATTSDQGTLADRLAERFPWMLALSAEDQVTCAADLIRAARASFATNQAHLATAELVTWRGTATAIAAGLGNVSADWLDGDEPVGRP